MTKVATGLLTNTGVTVPDWGYAQQEAATKIAAAHTDQNQLNLKSLPSLESEYRSLKHRLADREHTISLLTPESARLDKEANRLRTSLSSLNESLLKGEVVSGLKLAAVNIKKRLEQAETKAKAMAERLATSVKVRDATRQLLTEWEKQNGKTLKALRSLDESLDERAHYPRNFEMQ